MLKVYFWHELWFLVKAEEIYFIGEKNTEK